MENEKLLEVKNLAFSYDRDKKKNVFSGINFDLCPGEIFVILGANGAGKSTLLNCIAGMLSPHTGDVVVKGKKLTEYSDNDLALEMGYVPQITQPNFSYTVRDYVVMGRAPHLGLLRVPGKEEYAIADRVMSELGISKLAEKGYSNISGGERQQVQIAKVLTQETGIVLLDEPTNHLDYGNQLKIVKLISKLARENNIAVILTSHMPDHALLLNSKVGILGHDGHMLVGKASEVISENSLKNLYNTDLHLVWVEELNRVACVSGRLD